MSPARTVDARDDLLNRAREVYRRRIDPKVEAENDDRFVVFDLDSEDFEIGDDPIEIVARLKSRHPATRPFGFRVGDGGRAVDRFGSPRTVSDR